MKYNMKCYVYSLKIITFLLPLLQTTTIMKPILIFLLTLASTCLASDQMSEKLGLTFDKFGTDAENNSSSTTKKPDIRKTENRGISIGRMEVSDAQLEMVLKDKRYLQRQLKCTLGEAPCDPVGRRLRSLAPLVVRGSCPQCTQTEMRQIQKVLLHMQRNFPKEWAKVIRTYQ